MKTKAEKLILKLVSDNPDIDMPPEAKKLLLEFLPGILDYLNRYERMNIAKHILPYLITDTDADKKEISKCVKTSLLYTDELLKQIEQ